MHPESRQRRAPFRVLLVLVALLGVLGMHGLGAVPAAPLAVSAGAHHGHEAPDDGDGEGGHDRHAGPMCLAGAVAAPFAPPSPGPAPLPSVAQRDCPVGGLAGAEPEGGRAPPDLTVLQVLRR